MDRVPCKYNIIIIMNCVSCRYNIIIIMEWVPHWYTDLGASPQVITSYAEIRSLAYEYKLVFFAKYKLVFWGVS